MTVLGHIASSEKTLSMINALKEARVGANTKLIKQMG